MHEMHELHEMHAVPPRADTIKLFKFTNFRNKLVFVPGKPFQPSLMFMGEASGLPKSGAPERCFSQVGSTLTRKH